MSSISLIPLFSAFVSIFAIFITMLIFKKVFQEDYKRPWLFIGISIIFLALAKILDFLSGFFNINIVNKDINFVIVQAMEFVSISILTYAILLEFMILKYYKGKFVKFKFVPVQEGTLGGKLDINVSNGNSYFSFKKDKYFLLNEFGTAVKNGFEGFLITEENPKSVRNKYKIFKTPIAWITQIQNQLPSDYIKNSLDQNSDMVEPINLNNILNFVDNFLEQSSNPFIMIDLDLLFKFNNFPIVLEFLKYISSKINKFNGIMISNLNSDILTNSELNELKSFLNILE